MQTEDRAWDSQSQSLVSAGKKSGERRRDPRFGVDDMAILSVLEPHSSDPVEIRVLDISTNGAKLHVPEAVLPGTMVRVQGKNYSIVAETRYCIRLEGGFHIGVEIEEYSLMHEGAAPLAV